MTQFFALDDQGKLKIDMETIKSLSYQFDGGNRSDVCCLAKIVTTAYENGFEAGIEEDQKNQMYGQILMLHTGGTA